MDLYLFIIILIILIICCSLTLTNYINIIIIVLILCSISYLFIEYNKNDVIYVKSDIDDELYLVRNLPDKQYSANMLAKIKQNMLSLNDYLVQNISKFPDHTKYINLLNSKIRNSIIMENGENNVYTSYSVNKGEQIVFCLRSKKTMNKLHDMNLMMYVVLHEMSHVGCSSIGHGDEFKYVFSFFTQQAINIGLYKQIDFFNEPKEYCGMNITDSIV